MRAILSSLYGLLETPANAMVTLKHIVGQDILSIASRICCFSSLGLQTIQRTPEEVRIHAYSLRDQIDEGLIEFVVHDLPGLLEVGWTEGLVHAISLIP